MSFAIIGVEALFRGLQARRGVPGVQELEHGCARVHVGEIRLERLEIAAARLGVGPRVVRDVVFVRALRRSTIPESEEKANGSETE